MCRITVSDLTKKFGEKVVFNNLSFSIETGKKIVIIGPSGRGKTTLLRVLAGIVAPDTGSINFDDQPLTWQTAHAIRQKIAYLPQGVDLMAGSGNELSQMLSIDSKLAYPDMEYLGLSKDNIDQPFTDLSGGEKQRLLIALILSLSRPMLILDEPTSGLDSKTTERLMDLIWNKKDLTVISTSHNPMWEGRCDNAIKL